MSGIQHITLVLGAHNVVLDVKREQEQAYREAGAFLNKRYTYYSQHYRNVPEGQLWLYVALEAAVNLNMVSKSKSLEPVEEKAAAMNQLILKALGKTDETDENK